MVRPAVGKDLRPDQTEAKSIALLASIIFEAYAVLHPRKRKREQRPTGTVFLRYFLNDTFGVWCHDNCMFPVHKSLRLFTIHHTLPHTMDDDI
jgi:hypothetical protein